MIELDSTELDPPEKPEWPPPGSALAGLEAAWPSLFTAMAFLAVGLMQMPFPGFARTYLVKVMQVEFLIIHAGAMLTAVGNARLTSQPRPRRIMTYAFWALLALYILVSFSYGWYGPLLLLHATAATFWGIRRDLNKPGRMLALLLQWFVTVIVFVIVIETQHLPKEIGVWSDEPATHMAGFLYFAGLGVLTWAGLFRSTCWRRIEGSSPQDGRRGG